MPSSDRLDVVMRLHDARRLAELQRAVFSLVGQAYRPLNVHLCVQRFTRGMILDVQDALAPLLAMPGAPPLAILDHAGHVPEDARAALANLGLAAATGRYVAFLDYDDAVYPEAYALLTARLRRTGAAIAFAGVAAKQAEVEDDLIHVLEKSRPWSGRSLLDQFHDNCCPLHGFVMDRSIVPSDLRFDPSLCRLEDYDFLLRVCAGFRSDFALMETVVADYYLKSDGSNSTLIGASATEANLREWHRARAAVERRRRTTPVAPEVQRDAGLRTPIPGLTIRDLLDRLGRPPLLAA